MAMTAQGRPTIRRIVARRASDTLRGAGHVIRGWPGLSVTVAAYAVVAIALFGYHDGQIAGLVAALLIGVAWYLSPAGRWEAARRQRVARGGQQEDS